MRFTTYLLVLTVIASLTAFNEVRGYDYDDEDHNGGGGGGGGGGNGMCSSNRACTTASTPDCCSTRCTSIATDVANCGACGNACPKGPNSTPACAAGVCGATCTNGFGNCDATATNGCETNLQTDPANCGACGTACSGATPACNAGVCGAASGCTTGLGDCDANPANGCETDLTTITNCGTCGTVCPAGGPNSTPTCTNGVCGITCAAGFGDCDNDPTNGCEADLTLPTNCGVCGTTCPTGPNATPVCTDGVCAATCAAGFGDCDNDPTNGCETNTLTDLLSCGGCGTTCEIPLLPDTLNICLNGLCGLTCAIGFADCNNDNGQAGSDGCEVNTLLDINNCGACGNDCTQQGILFTCVLGICVGV